MSTISWSNIGVLILASFQLISFFNFQERTALSNKVSTLQVLATFLCSAITVSLLLSFPQAFPILLVLAIAGAVKIILLVTNNSKLLSFTEDKKSKIPTTDAKTTTTANRGEITYENSSAKTLDMFATVTTSPLPNADENLRQYQENIHLQNTAYLNQMLRNSATANNQTVIKPEHKVDNSAPSVFKTFLTRQTVSAKPVQSVDTTPVAIETINSEVNGCLDKISKQKLSIENSLHELVQLKLNNKTSIGDSPLTTMAQNVPTRNKSLLLDQLNKVQDKENAPLVEIITEKSSVCDVSAQPTDSLEYSEQTQQDKIEATPLFRPQLGQNKKMPGLRFR